MMKTNGEVDGEIRFSVHDNQAVRDISTNNWRRFQGIQCHEDVFQRDAFSFLFVEKDSKAVVSESIDMLHNHGTTVLIKKNMDVDIQQLGNFSKNI